MCVCGGLTSCGRHLKLLINSLVSEQTFIALHCGDMAGNVRVKVVSSGLMVFTGESPVFKDWNHVIKGGGRGEEAKAPYSDVQAGAERTEQLRWGCQVSWTSGAWTGEGSPG